jgi:hypothetical protein
MKKLLSLLLLLSLSSVAFASEAHHPAPAPEAEAVEAEEEEFFEEEEEEEELFEKKGFLTTEDCAVEGSFKDCYSESYVCGFQGCFEETNAGEIRPVQLVLFVHDDWKYYKVDTGSLSLSTLDKGIGRNEVTIIGNFNEADNTIVATEFKAPPPPKKSFFKGCL